MPIFNGQTEELLKAMPIPYNIRLQRREFVRLISKGLDVQVFILLTLLSDAVLTLDLSTAKS